MSTQEGKIAVVRYAPPHDGNHYLLYQKSTGDFVVAGDIQDVGKWIKYLDRRGISVDITPDIDGIKQQLEPFYNPAFRRAASHAQKASEDDFFRYQMSFLGALTESEIRKAMNVSGDSVHDSLATFGRFPDLC